MPRQTDQINAQFPDGFKLEISTDGTTGSTWEDVGVIAGGANLTFTWDDYYLDAGNYEGLVNKAKNPTFAIAPSAIWNWDPAVIANLFPGIMTNTAATDPSVGFDVDYTGTTNQVTLTRSQIRLTHYTVDFASQADQYIDWRWTFYNVKIDAGATFNMKGVNEDGLDEITVSFTGRPDPASTYRLFNYFNQT